MSNTVYGSDSVYYSSNVTLFGIPILDIVIFIVLICILYLFYKNVNK
jgi:hypothetical protein